MKSGATLLNSGFEFGLDGSGFVGCGKTTPVTKYNAMFKVSKK